jgi:hypothetical protein
MPVVQLHSFSRPKIVLCDPVQAKIANPADLAALL